jgi:SAM-dependent methyltransferase
MPYPTGPPKQKHDLVVPQGLPRDEGCLLLQSKFGFPDTTSLISGLESLNISGPFQQAVIVMTYNEVPEALSKAWVVLGFADASIKMIRQVISLSTSRSDPIPKCWQVADVAVLRGDGDHAKKLERYHVTNSPRFAKFMKRLQRESCVAIVAPDKMGRFGVLVPSQSNGLTESYSKDDFCATLFLGKLDRVKEHLTRQEINSNTEEEPVFVPTTPPIYEMDEVPTWQPPDDNNGSNDNLWKPPGESNNFDGDDSSAMMWRPPTEANDFVEDAWKPPTSASLTNSHPETTPTGRKRSRSDAESEKVFHADAGAAAADAFYSGLTRSLDTRADSRIFHMRAFNGWVKATQIQECDPRTSRSGKLRVLDLACGKGGDLGKWTHHKRGMEHYVGVDVARGSLRDAALRVRKIRHKLRRCTFSCADLGHDVPGRLRSKRHKKMQKLLTWSLDSEPENTTGDPIFSLMPGGGIALNDVFNVISVQFAIHYMMQTRKRARRFFQTASELLEIGGNLICTTIDARVVLERLMDQGLDLHDEGKHLTDFIEVTAGEGACRIRFTADTVRRIFKLSQNCWQFDAEEMFGLEYTFTLVEGQNHEAGVGDAVNLPEWLTPIPMLQAVAEDAGFELVSAENFHEFYDNRKEPSSYPAAHESLYNMKVLNRNGSIFPDNWDISRMYCAIKFRKLRESTMILEEDDVPDEVDSDENGIPESHENEISKKPIVDPIQEKKMLPIAMMKAKKNVGPQKWQELTSEDKKRLIQKELEILLNPEW